ncbi:MAG: EAL domain-containing protein [Gammaproteobacteria bacterium]|nr:MAG: EAL domain-containing protein [Gammaproteobacteria bacterium]
MQNNLEEVAPGKWRRYSGEGLNAAFNDFLQIGPADSRLLQTYHDALLQGGERFSKIFYAYLQGYPATAKVLDYYKAHGGKIEHLVAKQTQHLDQLLAGDTSEESAQRMAFIGEVHYRYRIEPVWIMGAYLLYLEHLQGLIRSSPAIRDNDRDPLDKAVVKLLFRDMGLMLEGYWDAAAKALHQEQDKVVTLQEQVTSLLANIPQLLWSVDTINNHPLYVSPSAREICQMDIDMPIPCLGWTIPEDRETVKLAWRKALMGHKVEVESRVQQPDGRLRWFRRIFYPLLDKTGRVVRIDGLMEDTTEAKAMIERLHALATTDSLSGLPNRTLFNDRLTQAIAAATRSDSRQVVLMLMDLNHFKEINDTLGHPAGDQMLVMVAQRLASALRDSDTLARLGGDEFGILLPDVTDAHRTVAKVAKKLLQCFVAPFRIGDNDLYLGAAIGVVVYPEHGEDVDTLMSRADIAMYGTKNKDVGYLFYDATLDPNAQARLQLAADLRQALARNELELHYQPKIDLQSGGIEGAEALIRWRHPQHGLIQPMDFLPIAERSGLITPITDWVIDTAVRQCMRWSEHGHRVRVAVNVPGRVFHDPGLVHRIAQMLKVADAPAECLEIEIIENVLMSDIEHVSRILDRISALGVHIAIDDFGTGYSSLAYLKKLPLKTLKIDKSFVMDMAHDENDAAIVRSTIDLAHNLGYRVIAEGIENAATHHMLAELGCDAAQGFHFSHPIPSEDFSRLLALA